MNDCKVAICEWSMPIKGPSMFAVMKELGLDGIQIDDWSSWEHNFVLSDKKVQEMYMRAAQEAQMQIPSIGCNGFSRLGGLVNRMGTDKGTQSLKALIKMREICEDMNIPLAMFPTCWSGYLHTEEDIENAAKMLREACKYYDDSPVNIAIESVLSPKQFRDLFSYVGSASLKIYYDTQNTQYFGHIYPPDEMRELDIADIAEIHFKEGLRESQGCLHYGDGETGFDEMVAILKEKAYDGWCVIENFYTKPSWRVQDKGIYDCIREDVSRLKKAFSM